MILLTSVVVAFFSAVIWFRLKWLSSLFVQLSRFWTPGPGGGFRYWCKWLFLRLVSSLNRRRSRFDFYAFGVPYDARQVGLLSPEPEASLDDIAVPARSAKAHGEESHQSDVECGDDQEKEDEMLVWACTERGECVLARVRRRPLKGTAEAWLYLRTADGQGYVLPPPRTPGECVDHSRSGVFAAAGLRLEQEVPMRRWRIAFNGLLRCTTQGNTLVHVQLGLVCKTSSNVIEHQADFPANFLARQLAKNWTKHGVPNVNRLLDEVDSYAQQVFCTGSATIDSGPAQELFLWGFRVRSRENGTFPLRSFGHIMGRTKSGICFYLRDVGIHGIADRYQTGMVGLPSTEIGPITDCSAQLMADGTSFKKNFSLEFGPGKDLFRYEIRTDYDPMDEQSLRTQWNGRSCEVKLSWWPCMVNEYAACLLHLSGPSPIDTANSTVSRDHCLTPSPELNKHSPTGRCRDTLSLDDAQSQCSQFTGGKGASLAALTHLAKNGLQVVVPEGFVVTTAAYRKFSRHPEVQSAIRTLSSLRSFTDAGSIETCNNIVRVLESTPLPEDVRAAIMDSYSMVFGSAPSDLRVAVRSSAEGEDSEDMSSAGQMDTFLGVRGPDEVVKTVVKCWSSQFTHIACGYKRRYGQPLESPMAVVVQAMAPAEVAGVLFTCDTRTGDPRRILITANHGLGDSVVSGKTDPDTIVLERCFKKNELKVAEISVGSKQHRTVMLESGGTELQSAGPKDGKCCLSTEQIMRLGKLATELEATFGSPRDIEWAFKGDTLFVLQARPVTSLYLPSDVEVMHDLDEGFRTMDECLTKANIGEVVNGAQSPLGISIFTNGLMAFNKEDTNERAKRFHNPYHDHFFVTSMENVFFPASNDLFNMSGEGTLRKGLAFAMRGGCMQDKDVERQMHERAQLRYTAPSFFDPRKMISDLWNSEKVVSEGYRMYYDCRLPVEKGDDSRKIFEEIGKSVITYGRTVRVHGAANMLGIMANSLAFTLIAKQRGEWSDAVVSDFASLMASSGDVWSAEVPSALQKMAVEITKDPESEKFKSMDTVAALNWLQESNTAEAFKDFLKRHGHRCINEFDVYSKTWAMDPKPLVKNLQAMAGIVDTHNKKLLSVEEAIDGLEIKFNSFNRKLLAWLLKRCRRGVALRELTKNLVVKAVDAIRSACWLLADQMQREGRLPEPELLFFLTLPEIDLLIRTRSPRLVAKALRRQRLHPVLRKRVFPELVKGIPTVVAEIEVKSKLGSSSVVKGTPVSGGIAEGPARVIRTIEEATEIKKGDVLVAYCTDIAWSPFFPLLSGVVTELGGLISHGAVVAREYGIPCVVGASGATSTIQSGSMVRLDGSRGTLEVIESS
ncbi:rifampicin phosphotransferase-like [Haemaphysalis longicornis]